MNFKQLRAFREVMLTGSVSKAAINLYRTQPAISAQIANLEAEVGFKLFTRRDGRLYPVPEAEYFLEQAVDILKQLDTVQENMKRVNNLETGRLNIAAMPGPSVFFIPQLISEFLRDREHVDISLFSYSSFQIQQLLSAQRYDVGVIDIVPDSGSMSLLNYDVLEYKCVCAVPADDPLAKKESITAQDLNNKALATLADTHYVFKQTKEIFEQQGLTMNRRFETQYFVPQLTFVEQGLACAIVDPLAVKTYSLYRKEQKNIKFLPFFPDVYFSVSIITPSHRPLSMLANTFISYLKNELQQLQ